MPAPTSTEEAARRRKAIDAAKAAGVTNPYTIAAEALGMSRNTLLNWDRNYVSQDPAIEAAKAAVRTALAPALVWAKTKPDADGNSFSVLLKPQDDAVDILDRLAEAFANVPAAPPVDVPAQTMADLLSIYPLVDVHLGMHGWGRETGGDDYDLKLAESDMRNALAKVTALTPDSVEAVLLVAGDFFHADDNRAETPANRHKLDVDGRQFKVTDAGVAILCEAIDTLLHKHARVSARVMRGNHDEHSHLILTHALAERYRLEPRCSVEKDPRDLYMRQWGTSAIFAHHGDKAKPQQMALYLSDVCPFWSATKHRHFFSGHVHHDQAKDLGPLRWESLRPFCPPDAYAASMGYGARRALQSVTFHLEDGLVQRNYDPIRRVA